MEFIHLLAVMKNLILFLFIIPQVSFCQTDTLLVPPPVDFPFVQEVSPVINIQWADSIINNIKYISLVQLRPSCPDRKKRKTIPANSKKRKYDCYMESTIITNRKKVPKVDSIFMTDVVLGFEEYRFYKKTPLDTSEYEDVIKATFGKRESNILTMCYIPRHAILFMDSMSNLLGIYEVCFE